MDYRSSIIILKDNINVIEQLLLYSDRKTRRSYKTILLRILNAVDELRILARDIVERV